MSTPTSNQIPGAMVAPDSFDETRLRLLVDFSRALRAQMVLAMFAMATVGWAGGADRRAVVAWLAAVLLVRELRAKALVRLSRAFHIPIRARLRQTAWWTLALGVAHGSSALMMPSLNTASSAVLTMIVISLCAGAVSTTYTVTSAFVAYTASISLLIALGWSVAGWSAGDAWQHWGIALLILMFLGVQIRFARQNQEMFAQSYEMRLENRELLEQLSKERELLSQARDDAVRADMSKSRFLAAASHDLRQPLQSLSLNSGALSRMRLEDESLQIAQEMSAGIESLRQMLDGLLDISQIDAGAMKPQLQQIPLDLLALGVCARFRPAAEARGLKLHCSSSSGLYVTSDAEMLRRIVSNLLDNAIKYTEHGEITVLGEKFGEQVTLTIQDTGCGIEDADRERVFEDLTQLHNPQRDRTKGYGLGLGIVRRLSRLVGIEYEVASRVGQGTTFRLMLPAADGVGHVVSSVAHAQPGLVARRVLVLDDDDTVRSAYAHALESLGCKVLCVGTLEEAMASLPRHRAEVALVDYRLARSVNGLEAIAQLRSAWPGLAAILVSADSDRAMREEAQRLGVPYLRKPVTDVSLAAAINGVLHDAAKAPRSGSASLEEGVEHGNNR